MVCLYCSERVVNRILSLPQDTALPAKIMQPSCLRRRIKCSNCCTAKTCVRHSPQTMHVLPEDQTRHAVLDACSCSVHQACTEAVMTLIASKSAQKGHTKGPTREACCVLFYNHCLCNAVSGQAESSSRGIVHSSPASRMQQSISLARDGHELSCCDACLSHNSLLNQNKSTLITAEREASAYAHTSLDRRYSAAAGAV